jgi:hypothetical protein
MVQGACLCGDVAWAAGSLELVVYCHCSVCRKITGASFASSGSVLERDFRWLRGGDATRRFESSPGLFRRFCGRCGSTVPNEPVEGRVFLPLGNLDGDPGLRPFGHIFVGSKAPWYEIADALPQFETLPSAFILMSVPARPRRPSPPGGALGSCLCDAVGYEVEGGIPFLRNCHCSRCRRARGTAHATNTFVPIDRLRWTRGAARVKSFQLPDARYFTQAFCELCGSPQPRVDAERGIAVIPAGSIDGDPGVRTREHIFVGSKAPWFEIADALPQYAEQAPSL